MKILFAMSSPEYLRYYDDTIAELASRGHDVVIAVNAIREGKPVRLSAVDGVERVAIAGLIPARGDRWISLARAVRGTMDFVRYLHPQLADAEALRARVKRQALPWPLARLDRRHSRPAAEVARMLRRLERVERAIPIAGALTRFLDEHDPDLVLVSPLIEPTSDQVDLVRAAQARGTRVGTLIASWDNLTNKGDLRVRTQRIFVWNEAQKREAIELHRADPSSLVVTGSQVFDRWFDRVPSKDRETFCRDVGLPDTRPFVLFTGSSIFIARAEHEMPFVRGWIDALRRSSDPAVRELHVLVRPHPYNGRAWNPDVFAGMPGVAVWPRGGYDPIDAANRHGFFDAMFHAEAVVGINTSAMIESAIVGRPVLSIAAAEFADTQGGTLHFRHLLPENGGFLRVASSLEQHVDQLAGILRDPAAARAELATFVGRFIRPFGPAEPATPRLASAIEEYGRSAAPAPLRRTAMDRIVGVLLLPVAGVASWFPPESGRRREGRLRGAAARFARGARQTLRGLLTTPRREIAKITARAARPLRTTHVSPIVAAALFVPIACTGLTLAFAGAEVAGLRPVSIRPPANIAEAAAMGMAADVLRFRRMGQDPEGVYPVDPEVISPAVTQVTALEAMIWSRSIELVRLLDREALIPDTSKPRLACLARANGIESIVSHLAPAGLAGCDPDAVYLAIEARAR